MEKKIEISKDSLTIDDVTISYETLRKDYNIAEGTKLDISQNGDKIMVNGKEIDVTKYQANATETNNDTTTATEEGSTTESSSLTSDSTLATLSDTTLEINTDAVSQICNSWKAKIQQEQLDSVDIESIFSPLTSCEIATSYIPSLKNSLSQISQLVLEISSIIESSAQEQQEIDDSSYLKNGKENGYNGLGNGYVGGSGGSSPITVYDDTTVDNNEKDLNIKKELLETIQKLDPEKYQLFMTTLANICNDNTALKNNFTDSQYNDRLKKMLLESPNIPSDIKKMIIDMNPEILQKTLFEMLDKKDSNMSSLSHNIIYSYLESIAKNQNIPISSLLKDKDSLFTTLQELTNSYNVLEKLSKEKDALLDVYNGNSVEKIEQTTLSFVRNAIDKIAEQKQITVESLLTDSSQTDYLNQSISNMNKSISYLNEVGHLDFKTASDIMKKTFIGN